ncbi:MAG: cyclic nucleotide-binding-like protein [Piptocephalis tieghemiana]|nr:MAG: cyclic nucleotide-binding-like protein [Piptocephalis tieghemiana]
MADFSDLSPVFLELMTELAETIRPGMPDDIYQHCANFFNSKLETQRAELVAIAKGLQTAGPALAGELADVSASESESERYPNRIPEEDEDDVDEDIYRNYHEHEEDSDDEEDEEEDEEGSFSPRASTTNVSSSNGLTVANGNARGRRVSVSAESMAPSADDEFVKVHIPKSDDQRARIHAAIAKNFLFRNLDDEQAKDVVDAMAEKPVLAGEVVIQQGGVGDYFYIVETGALDVYVSKTGPSERGVKVTDYVAGGSFGELALMYNAPRAATVVATADSVLWALDRVTFRRILMERTSRKRRMYENFLEEVPLLISLEPYERHKIADALESTVFQDGEEVVVQGGEGDRFYIIESGRANVSQRDATGQVHHLIGLTKGDYFGELALLNDQPRAATVTAQGRLKVAALGKKAFVRLLGPVVEIIKRNATNYQKVSSYVKE